MKTIRKIGVVLKEGCDIEGGQFAIDAREFDSCEKYENELGL